MAKAPKNPVEPTTELVKALANILDDAGLAELEYETDDVAIRLSRVSGAAPVAAVAMWRAPHALASCKPIMPVPPAPAVTTTVRFVYLVVFHGAPAGTGVPGAAAVRINEKNDVRPTSGSVAAWW